MRSLGDIFLAPSASPRPVPAPKTPDDGATKKPPASGRRMCLAGPDGPAPAARALQAGRRAEAPLDRRDPRASGGAVAAGAAVEPPDEEIAQSDQDIQELRKPDPTARRLMSIPGIGPITASAVAASPPDVSAFSGPREFAAFPGLVPRRKPSGGEERSGRVSKLGDRYLRKPLVVGAHAALFLPRRDPWRCADERSPGHLVPKDPHPVARLSFAAGLRAVMPVSTKQPMSGRLLLGHANELDATDQPGTHPIIAPDRVASPRLSLSQAVPVSAPRHMDSDGLAWFL